VRYIESFNTRLGKILAGGVFVLIFILVFEGVSRYVFNNPTPWSVELAQFVFGTYVFVGGGYVLLRGGHVRMDALYTRWSPRRKAIVDLVTFSCVAGYFIVFLWGGIPNTAYSLSVGQHYKTMWGPPIGPIKIIILVGATILFLQTIALFIRDLSIIRGEPIE